MAGRLTSPFIHSNVDVAFAAYCAMPFAGRADFKKPTKAAFRKLHAKKHPEAVAKSKAAPAPKAATAQVVVEAPRLVNVNGTYYSIDDATGILTPVTQITDTQPAVGNYRERTAREDIPADAARNSVLWALNTEGLLTDAIERSEGGCITQAIGTALLSETFGPFKS